MFVSIEKNKINKPRNKLLKDIIIISFFSIFWVGCICWLVITSTNDKILFGVVIASSFLLPALLLYVAFSSYMYHVKGLKITSSSISLPDLTIPLSEIDKLYWNPNKDYCTILLKSVNSIKGYPYSYIEIPKAQIPDEDIFINSLQRYVDIRKNETITRAEIKKYIKRGR